MQIPHRHTAYQSRNDLAYGEGARAAPSQLAADFAEIHKTTSN